MNGVLPGSAFVEFTPTTSGITYSVLWRFTKKLSERVGGRVGVRAQLGASQFEKLGDNGLCPMAWQATWPHHINSTRRLWSHGPGTGYDDSHLDQCHLQMFRFFGSASSGACTW